MSQDSFIQTGQGQPVLMLHSSMSSKSQWKGLIQSLRETHQVIAVDLLGYGAAGFPEQRDTYRLRDELDHIDRILEQAGVSPDQKIQVIGHSFGGATGLSWCYANPERVQSLHLYEPVAFHLLQAPCPGLDQITGVTAELDQHLAAGDPRAATQAFIDYWSGPGAFASFPENVQDAMVSQIDKVVLDFQALMAEPRRVQDYAGFEFPITLIMGTQSPIASQRVSQTLKDHLPGLDFHQVDCGHMGPITHAALVNEIFAARVMAS